MRVSADGNYWWDGMRWVPVARTTAAPGRASAWTAAFAGWTLANALLTAANLAGLVSSFVGMRNVRTPWMRCRRPGIPTASR